MDHTKARAIAEALTHGGADDIELIELAAAYLDALRQLAERDGVVASLRLAARAKDSGLVPEVTTPELRAWADRLEGK